MSDFSKKIEDSLNSESSKVYAGRKISQWFSIYLRISILGHVIYEVTWPPQKGGEK